MNCASSALRASVTSAYVAATQPVATGTRTLVFERGAANAEGSSLLARIPRGRLVVRDVDDALLVARRHRQRHLCLARLLRLALPLKVLQRDGR